VETPLPGRRSIGAYGRAGPRVWPRAGAGNFAELEQVLRCGVNDGYAFSEFLDEFYCYRQAAFFVQPPSDYFNPKQRAFFAALAEYMSNRFHRRFRPGSTSRSSF
jgi:hypothetical protein